MVLLVLVFQMNTNMTPSQILGFTKLLADMSSMKTIFQMSTKQKNCARVDAVFFDSSNLARALLARSRHMSCRGRLGRGSGVQCLLPNQRKGRVEAFGRGSLVETRGTREFIHHAAVLQHPWVDLASGSNLIEQIVEVKLGRVSARGGVVRQHFLNNERNHDHRDVRRNLQFLCQWRDKWLEHSHHGIVGRQGGLAEPLLA